MVSAVYPVNTVAGLELNTLGDGFFHVGAYLFTPDRACFFWAASRGATTVRGPWVSSSAPCCWAGAYLTLSKAWLTITCCKFITSGRGRTSSLTTSAFSCGVR